MQLRPRQLDCIARVFAVLPRNPILVSPTGTGKTVMGAEVVRTANVRTLWVADRRELIQQAAGKLRGLGLSVGVLLAGHAADPSAQVQVASIQTLNRREVPADIALAVIDECDLAAAESYAEILALPGFRLGLTATPFRLDGTPLGRWFGELVVAGHVADFVAEGHLIAPDVLTVPVGRALAGVPLGVDGDFDPDAASRAMREGHLVGDIVSHWTQHAPGVRSVAFASNIRHSEAIVAAFRDAGWAWGHLDGSTPAARRDDMLAALAAGDIHGISNVGVIARGWDLPTLGCVIVARPTMSLNLHLQMIGRAMRPADGKVAALVLDHAGNHHRHGAVTRRLEYSLDGPVRGDAGDVLGVRRCAQCGLHYATGLAACPECGAAAPAGGERQVRTAAGELAPYDEWASRWAFWDECERERIDRGLKPGWAAYRYKERFGEWPNVMGGTGLARILINPDDASNENKRAVYAWFRSEADRQGYSAGWAARRYRDVFGVWPKGVGGGAEAVRDELRERWTGRVQSGGGE